VSSTKPHRLPATMMPASRTENSILSQKRRVTVPPSSGGFRAIPGKVETGFPAGMRQTGTGPIFASEKRELVQRQRWPALAAAGVYGIAAEASGRRRLGSDRPGALRAAEGIPEIAER